eukprot:TRINITY_DN2648_c0_g1_i1.p1 TRINITY_DN2648_c0_g1~~TRINITY_DN2648_c0_g1_i1.p1  ORF type:complete len:447 (-),score=140.03 TRINITY_DN2648_c0_g1_i1:451-1791(-)
MATHVFRRLVANPAVVLPGRLVQRSRFSSQSGGPQVTQLQNGAKVISLNTSLPTAAVGIIVNAGSAYETHETMGSAGLLSQMAYKSTQSLSSLRLTRLIESTTHSFRASADREGLSYNMEVMRDNVSPAVELLGDMLRPRLPEWEVRDQKAELAGRKGSSGDDTIDLVHHVAFRGQGLGHPTGVPAWNFDNLSHEALQEYVAQHFTGANVALVGVGVDHAQFVKDAEKAIGSLPAGEAVRARPSIYHGGELLVRRSGPTTVAIGFESAAWGSDALATQHVLMRLLGGNVDRRHSPGTGVTSRLAVLAQENAAVRSACYFSSAYAGSGVAGVKAVAVPGGANAVGEVLMGVMQSVADGVSDEEAKRASALLRSDACSYFDARLNVLAFLQKEAQRPDGQVRDPAAIAGGSLAASAQQLQEAARALLSQPGTAVVAGDISGVGLAAPQ